MATQENDVWYYVSEGNERLGPISIQELGSLATRGIISPKTLVWNPAQPEWIPAEKIADLINSVKTPLADQTPEISRPEPQPSQQLKPRKGSFIFPRLVATCIVSALFGGVVASVLFALEHPAWFGLPAFLASFLLGIFSALVAYRKERYELQAYRLVCHRGGLFSDEATEFEIRNITHVKVKLPWLRYKLYCVGDVIVETAGSSKPMVMRAIREPETIYAGIRERMKSNGYDLTQRELLHEEQPALIGVFGECIGMFVGAAFFFLVFIGGILSDTGISIERELMQWGLGVLILIILSLVILRFLDLRRRTYRVFNDVVVYEEGFLTRQNAFIPFENIADSNTKRTLIDQIFGLYDVLISCQGSSSEIKFRRLKNGIQLSSVIDQLVSAAAKKPKPGKAASHHESITRRPSRSEPEIVSTEGIRMAEYRIHALRLLIPQMLLLPLFPIWILAMLKSLILLSSTRYFVRSGSLRHSYKFLTVDEREFSYDKITGVVIRKNLWDKWFGTMTLKFWSIGSGKSLEFAHIHCDLVDLPALLRQVGIPQASGDTLNIDTRFGVSTWLRAQLWLLFLCIPFAVGVAVTAVLAEEPLAYALLAIPIILIAFGLTRAKLYYPRQRLSFHEHHIEAEQGIIAKSRYFVRYKNVKRITATRYPGGEDGELTIYVAGEEQANAQAGQTKGRKPTMMQCSFASGMLPDPGKTAALLDEILSGRIEPSPTAIPAAPSEALAESPRSVGNALAALFLTSIFLFPLIALLPITIPFTVIRVKRWRYRIEDFRIVASHGIFYRSETSVLLDRVDSLQQSQGLLNKIFRNGKVSVMTAGSSEPDLVIIDAPAYRKLHDIIRENSGGN